ncbi:sensor domain-containing diguanylate cyclase [Vibrio ostreae]|uniref:Sensor domain-containing diguanylate cyclase n=1 Tax=Vibrio ostreae TaxID=2841925 RepID=A0A975U998_9VIBR|nr:sensor domain-containing diguanylate cyclase [Vibrio ostreae]QXO17574.1 sensor domain-containing diguanylate cyclase [Vibrio ostreae]
MKRVTNTLKKTVILWLGLTLLPLGFYYHLSNKAHQFLLNQLEAQGLQFLSFVDAKASRTHSQIQKSFYQLSHSPLLADYARDRDPRLRRYLESQWSLTSFNSGLFYQLRFLDLAGKEVIRVDYTRQMTQAFVVPQEQLQEKGHRDYFIYARQLAVGEQGYFGIDLEYEHGLPLIPYKPGFRLLYPLDTDQRRLGYFIANLDVMAVIKQITANNQNLSVDFVDRQGYFIVSSDENRLFGDLIQSRASLNLPNEHPEVWQAMQANNNTKGSLTTKEGLFIYQRFDNQLFSSVGGLMLLTHYTPDMLSAMFAPRNAGILKDAIVIWLLLGIVSVILAMFWIAHKSIKMDKTYAQFVIENGVAIVFTNREHRILRVSKRFCDMVGMEPFALQGRSVLNFLPSRLKQREMHADLINQGHWEGQYTLQNPHGDEVVCKTDVRALSSKLKKVQYYVYSFTDISDHHNAIIELKERSERDSATALWNKKKFENMLNYHTRLHQRYPDEPPACLAVIDIDSFKDINDTLGHAVGDVVILHVAQQLQALLRDTDFIARIGGDEFAVIIQHTDIHQAGKLMQRVCSAIANWPQYQVTISVGVAEVTKDAIQTATNADKAMYRSKRKGKNCVSLHGFENLTVVEPQQS